MGLGAIAMADLPMSAPSCSPLVLGNMGQGMSFCRPADQLWWGEVMGLMYLWDVKINIVSLINLIMVPACTEDIHAGTSI